MRDALKMVVEGILPERATLALDLIWKHKRRFGVLPNIRHPRTFNEKVLHRMLFDRRAILSKLADKLAARDYVEKRIGPQVLPRLLFATTDPSKIPLDELPDKFVVKPTHGSGWVTLVPDKTILDRLEFLDTCNRWLNQNYYDVDREWVYRRIKPRILVEEFISDGTGLAPTEYKPYVFNGRVEFISVTVGRFEDHAAYIYGRSWNKVHVAINSTRACGEADRPKHLNEIIEYAEILGDGIDFIRADFYDTEDRVYFGELTTTPGAGRTVFRPKEFDRDLGELWRLPQARTDGSSNSR
ncbi:MAG TPA: ATP-grasp fold amidoligase family protein [bacterium]|nr:ATP-grasp fold amidoligase family protein [bacterium]